MADNERILWCLNGTIDVGLVFDRIGGIDDFVVRFVDSDYGGVHKKMKSLTV